MTHLGCLAMAEGGSKSRASVRGGWRACGWTAKTQESVRRNEARAPAAGVIIDVPRALGLSPQHAQRTRQPLSEVPRACGRPLTLLRQTHAAVEVYTASKKLWVHGWGQEHPAMFAVCMPLLGQQESCWTARCTRAHCCNEVSCNHLNVAR